MFVHVVLVHGATSWLSGVRGFAPISARILSTNCCSLGSTREGTTPSLSSPQTNWIDPAENTLPPLAAVYRTAFEMEGLASPGNPGALEVGDVVEVDRTTRPGGVNPLFTTASHSYPTS